MKGQHHISSFVEVVVSNVLSFFIDVGFILFFAPYLGLNLSVPTLTIGFILLYCVHILKSFLYRRFCNYLMLKGLERKGVLHVDTKKRKSRK